jgi:ADP-heptose:LPS heptosyltransferase
VSAPPAGEVLAGSPFLASCAPTLAALQARLNLDVVVCYNSGAYWREVIEAAHLGIPNRVGYIHKGFSALVTHPITINYPQSYPAYFRDLVAQLTGKLADWSLRPRIYPTSADEFAAESIWSKVRLERARPVVACFATSRQKSGVWPAHKFGEILSHIEANTDFQTLLLGAGEDRACLEQLSRAFHLRAKVIAGELSLLALGCFLRNCAAVLCPDSGPRHIANAVEARVFFARNLAVRQIETGPYLETEYDLSPDVECLSPREQLRIFSQMGVDELASRIIAVTLK